MPTLRQTRSLARLVLAWFALFVAVATAGTIANPQPLELICSSDGAVRLQVQTPDGTPALLGDAMDCAMCLLPGAPPPVASLPVLPLWPALAPVEVPGSQVLAALSLPPLPPRGPPSTLSIA